MAVDVGYLDEASRPVPRNVTGSSVAGFLQHRDAPYGSLTLSGHMLSDLEGHARMEGCQC